MKTTILLFASAVLALGVTNASARCVGSVVNGNCLGAEVPGADSSDYRGFSGSRYEYDLTNPSDRNRYSTDLDAQRRDSMSLGVGRSLDRGVGQYGGGIWD